MLKKALLTTLLLLATTSLTWASDLAGKYAVKGTNPGHADTYQGEALVVRQGDVYVVAWRIGSQQFMGTGLHVENSFAVVYEGEGAPAGLVLYKIHPNGELTGIYTNLGQTEVGTETWKPVSP